MTTSGWSQCPYCRTMFKSKTEATAHVCPKLELPARNDGTEIGTWTEHNDGRDDAEV